jgi:glyoxylase-like metal-dependent hydrolase (beta-lactamase superfamily II)
MHLRRVAPEIWVGISHTWQTTHTVCGTAAALVIDGPVSAVEQAALAARVTATHLIPTHADWDHLLAPRAFPNATRSANAATIDRLRSDHDAISDELARWDASQRQPIRPLPDWRDAQAIRPPVTISSPVGPIEISSTPGHTRDGIALLITEHGALIAGDYLSPCEVPSLAADARWEDYLASLDLLERLLMRARCVVPGHGWPLDVARARTILTEDRAYVAGLGRGDDPPLPRQRANASQQRQHGANLAAVRAR